MSSLYFSREQLWPGTLDSPPRSIDSFDTLIEWFSAQYTINRFHRMTSAALASMGQADKKSLGKFMDKLGGTTAQIWNLNPEVVLVALYD